MSYLRICLSSISDILHLAAVLTYALPFRCCVHATYLSMLIESNGGDYNSQYTCALMFIQLRKAGTWVCKYTTR
ncbi:hypothetical protein F4679DRAFT_567414 [Xylaria curta]|nr:hypothetical protein F4679DRAFT_567414 [Xylaria curta]